MRSRYADSLVSCPGSLEFVDLPAYGCQLEITLAEPDVVSADLIVLF